MYLRATATYTDQQGGGKTAYVISNARTLHKASAEPRFLDDDGEDIEIQRMTTMTDDNAFATPLDSITPEIQQRDS